MEIVNPVLNNPSSSSEPNGKNAYITLPNVENKGRDSNVEGVSFKSNIDRISFLDLGGTELKERLGFLRFPFMFM